MNIEDIHKTIKSKGKRLTKVRKAIIEILIQSPCLLSTSDLLSKLKARRIQPDRSTMYRELMFLVQNSIINKNIIAQKDYFELPTDHHHHLVCTGCNAIKKVIMGNHLVKEEKLLEKNHEFTITNHSVEFYGLCRNCRK
ncbi:MAG: transcriptional repressor [Planctomycetaceae bacterium]|nr:transcriptional repressor [Planctomycetaceae bacterium]